MYDSSSEEQGVKMRECNEKKRKMHFQPSHNIDFESFWYLISE